MAIVALIMDMKVVMPYGRSGLALEWRGASMGLSWGLAKKGAAWSEE